jgi:hypothetical protein
MAGPLIETPDVTSNRSIFKPQAALSQSRMAHPRLFPSRKMTGESKSA